VRQRLDKWHARGRVESDKGWCEEEGWKGREPGEEEEAAEEDGWEDEGADEVTRAGRGLGREDGNVHLETGKD
jgi:hypothetical protein